MNTDGRGCECSANKHEYAHSFANEPADCCWFLLVFVRVYPWSNIGFAIHTAAPLRAEKLRERHRLLLHKPEPQHSEGKQLQHRNYARRGRQLNRGKLAALDHVAVHFFYE